MVTVDTDPKQFVAKVKATYVEKLQATQHREPNYVVLVHNGVVLEDDKQLRDYKIHDGATLLDIEPATMPYSKVDYHKLAEEIKEKQGANQEKESWDRLRTENVWAADTEGHMHNLTEESREFGGQIIRIDPSQRIPQPSADLPAHGRRFHSHYSIRVGTCIFNVLPRMEGRWNGEVIAVPSATEEVQVCSAELLFNEQQGAWVFRQSRTVQSGLTTTMFYWLRPIANGLLKVETDDPALKGCDIRLEEQGNHILSMVAISRMTGKPILVETTTWIGKNRLRTQQYFTESGMNSRVLVISEKRVVDTVSGAVTRFDENLMRDDYEDE